MTSPLVSQAAPFGRVLTAMVTPFTQDGELDLDAAQRVASYLVDAGNDGLVVSGTTGESPTTSIKENRRLLAAVLEAVGDRATIVAGVGTNDTRHGIELAEQARKTGAHGLLIVSPYYSKPTQPGLQKHFLDITAAGGEVPVILYDIPGRTGVRIGRDTFDVVASDERIVAVKDAVGDFVAGAQVMADTGLVFYSGDDGLNLGWLAYGAAGMVSVVGHVAARHYADMVAAVDAGDLVAARHIHHHVAPALSALMDPPRQGAVTAKAALKLLGVLEHSTVRSPLVELTDDEVAELRAGLQAADLIES
ncbi:MAG TPA: 4-hydroxy-tetrahydrodipicolinate synthase [Aeromicrobium sp.]|nr:4-hydroxy-tetrahydrodipicolinate synthase [Aeromicrobium sp.]